MTEYQLIEPLQLGVGALLAIVVAGGGYASRALTGGGAVGAVIVGTTIFGVGGFVWGVPLVVFFVSSSLLTGWRSGAKERAAAEFEKGGRRDLGQVLANGGVPARRALLDAVIPGSSALPALVGALAVATADTWATELGLLSSAPPRLITTGAQVPPGTSGGITQLGLLASAGGGLLIGLVTLLISGLGPALLILSTAAAIVGSLVDSLLGATVQALYYCPLCEVETERSLHHCGQLTEPSRGWSGLDNDRVNLIAIMAGACVGWVLGQLVL